MALPVAPVASRIRTVRVKTESTYGVAVTTAEADALRTEDIQTSGFQVEVIESNANTGALDAAAPVPGRETADITLTVRLGGVTGGAGTSPIWGRLFQACGWAETVVAAPIPAAAEACGAAGGTTTAELGSSAAATAHLYLGLPINLSETVTLSTLIAGYTAGKIATLAETASAAVDADTNYQIPACVVYRPTSDKPTSCTVELYQSGVRHVFVGCRGSADVTFEAGQPVSATFNLQGYPAGAATDTQVPADVYTQLVPPSWKSGKSLIDRVAFGINNLSLSGGVTLTRTDDPGSASGYGEIVLTNRQLTASVSAHATTEAARSGLALVRAATQQILLAQAGTAAGSRIALTLPSAQLIQDSVSDLDGTRGISAEYRLADPNRGAAIVIW